MLHSLDDVSCSDVPKNGSWAISGKGIDECWGMGGTTSVSSEIGEKEGATIHPQRSLDFYVFSKAHAVDTEVDPPKRDSRRR